MRSSTKGINNAMKGVRTDTKIIVSSITKLTAQMERLEKLASDDVKVRRDKKLARRMSEDMGDTAHIAGRIKCPTITDLMDAGLDDDQITTILGADTHITDVHHTKIVSENVFSRAKSDYERAATLQRDTDANHLKALAEYNAARKRCEVAAGEHAKAIIDMKEMMDDLQFARVTKNMASKQVDDTSALNEAVERVAININAIIDDDPTGKEYDSFWEAVDCITNTMSKIRLFHDPNIPTLADVEAGLEVGDADEGKDDDDDDYEDDTAKDDDGDEYW